MSDSHEHTPDKASIWSSLAILLSLALTLFVLVSGASLILTSLSFTRAIEHPAPPAASSAPAPAAAPSAAAAPAAAPSGSITEITLKPGPVNPMSFETTSFKVKAGSKIKVTFSNEGNAPLQHNLVIGKIGSKDKLIAASNSMLTDMAGAMAKGYIPDSPEILAHTKLLNLHDKETLEITVPAEKGSYPYLCTFPGHAAIMNGTMEVE